MTDAGLSNNVGTSRQSGLHQAVFFLQDYFQAVR